MQGVFPYIVATLKCGFRLRSLRAVIVVAVLLAMGSWMAAEFSPRAPATVSLDTGISLIRFVLVILALLWAQEYFAKDIERRAIYSLLSQPVSRSAYLLGRFLGVLLLLGGALLIYGAVLALVVQGELMHYGGQRPPAIGIPYLVTLLGIYIDLVVVLAFAWLITSLSVTPLLPFSLGLIFAWSAHTLGPVLNYLAGHSSEAERLAPTFQPILDLVRWLIPDLSQLDVRHLALYDLPISDAPNFVFALLLALTYSLLLLSLAGWAMERREFD